MFLKPVTMAMPTYAMSCFKLPVKVMQRNQRSDGKILVGGEDNARRKMHWCLWKKMSTEKNTGGLGFKDLQGFNKALLGKQIWRILACLHLLLSKMLRAKYYPKTSPLRW